MSESGQMKIQVEAWEMVPYGEISSTVKFSPKGPSEILDYLALDQKSTWKYTKRHKSASAVGALGKL